MSKNLIPAATLFLLLVLSFAAFVRDKEAPQQEGAKAVSRVISLAPSVTELIYYLGEGDKLVAVTRYCNYPKEAGYLPKVGGILDVNFEAVAALSPDIIILTDFDKDLETRLNALGFKTLLVNHQSLEGVTASIAQIAGALGISNGGELSENFEREIEEIARVYKDMPRLTVLVSLFRARGYITKLTVAGGDGYFNKALALLNAQNPFENQPAYITVTREGLYGIKPDLVVDLIYEEGEEEVYAKDWESLSPYFKGEVCVVSSSYGYTPGPRFKLFLEKLAECMPPSPDTLLTQDVTLSPAKSAGARGFPNTSPP